jgi:hypothetical protein
VNHFPGFAGIDYEVLCAMIKKPEVHDLFSFKNGKIKQNCITVNPYWLSLISDGQADA